MTIPVLSLAGDAATLSPVALFLQADIVVKVVMIGLLCASIWTWGIIMAFWMSAGGVARKSAAYEKDFWRSDDIDGFFDSRGKDNVPSARVFAAAVAEWRRSTRMRNVDREGTRDRLSTAMASAVSEETDRLADRLNILATVGAVAPFVGLFGTVWGIMDTFKGIGLRGSATLAVVAPGISEALIATAAGLAAAIPAVIFYNYYLQRIKAMTAEMDNFSGEFLNIIERYQVKKGQ